MEWSYEDAMVIAVSWKNGGLSLWSVFGTLLLCSLGDQPGYVHQHAPRSLVLIAYICTCTNFHEREIFMIHVFANEPRTAKFSTRENSVLTREISPNVF